MSIDNNDTIAAIASASGNGSISIIRVSGSESICVVDSIFYKSLSYSDKRHTGFSTDKSTSASAINENRAYLINADTHTVHHGWIGSSADDLIDEALVLIMRAPKSYTAEDVVEIQCHGGGLAARKILELLIDKGVRLAEPGEFTKRAFINGRIDLTQAESVMEIISSKSDLALSTAGKHLRGDVRDKIRSMREVILTDMAYLEAALDDPEHIELDDYSVTLLSHLSPIENELDIILKNAENGRLISEGIKTVIVGRPNVGKSSFLNCILREDRAIVTDIPGTTRDTLEEDVRIGGVLLRLIDTAGIRETSDTVERIGVDKAKSAMEEADLIICVLDASEEITDEDISLIKACRERPGVILLNKSDLDAVISVDELIKNDISDTDDQPIILEFSAKTGEGLSELESLLEDLFLKEFYSDNNSYKDSNSYSGSMQQRDVSDHNNNQYNNVITGKQFNEPVITSLRQKEALMEVKRSFERLRKTIDDGMPEDLLTVDLLAAYEDLGKVTGDTMEDDLADKIFSDFCIGK